ncbi:MAG: phosphoribosylformylglycinamidine synthase subunit PurS [Armatimonadetes bacterium]|nr:phosphoribosylformylglycinamidine synthase subunit PurS [Armatimonadota bacterium]MDW8122847.1 phosphoribosylformylglycinamidine synthase subunit PurS [Armatimonadota bacterium]
MRRVTVLIRLKETVDDAQGRVVCQALKDLGFSAVAQVRIGKVIDLWLEDADDLEQTKKMVAQMCQVLLANPVIEEFEVWQEEGSQR